MIKVLKLKRILMLNYITKTSLGLLLLSFLISSCSKYEFNSTFSTHPHKPHAGEEVTLLYNPTGTALEGSNQISVIVRTYGDRNYQPASMFSMPNNVANTEEYKMSTYQEGWITQFSVPDTVVGFVVTLHNENETDYNGGLGYWVPMYSSDQNLLPGAEAGYAAALVRRGWGAELDKVLYADTLVKLYENEYQRNPEMEPGFAFSYFSALKKSRGAEGFVQIERHLEAMSDPELWTEEHMFFLSAWYGAIKNPEKADLFKTSYREKYPQGRWVQREEIGKIYKAGGLSEKIKFLEEFESRYPSGTDLSYIYGFIIGEYIKEGSYALALDYLNALNGAPWNERPVFAAVNSIKEIENDESQELIEIITKSVNIYRQEFEQPGTPKPPLIITSVWRDNRAAKLALALDALGTATRLAGNISDAVLYYEEAYNLSNKSDKLINEHFAAALVKGGSMIRAKEVLEKSIQSGAQSPKMEVILEEVFIAIHGSDENYTSYYSNLKSSGMISKKAKIEAKLVTEKAPAFTLLDTDGNEVSLSDYEGKIVIMDFWATWCGPCKASFPAMNEAIDKYKNNDQVKFLFVNTLEKSKNKLQAATDYLNSGGFDFHVLMDDMDKVAHAYQIGLLPTKVFIDGAGDIRYRSSGFRGVIDLLEEIEVLISVLEPRQPDE